MPTYQHVRVDTRLQRRAQVLRVREHRHIIDAVVVTLQLAITHTATSHTVKKRAWSRVLHHIPIE